MGAEHLFISMDDIFLTLARHRLSSVCTNPRGSVLSTERHLALRGLNFPSSDEPHSWLPTWVRLPWSDEPLSRLPTWEHCNITRCGFTLPSIRVRRNPVRYVALPWVELACRTPQHLRSVSG